MTQFPKISRKKAFTIAAACAMTFVPAFGQDDDEELDLGALFDIKVTTASKRAENLSEAPGVITSISRYEIDKMGAKNLMDILAQVPGLQMYNSEAFGINKASLRGDAFSYLDNHTLILVNGRPIREGVRQGFNAPVYKLFPINIIERVEVVRGPGSVLYGSTAMTGVINIITQKETAKTGAMIGASDQKDIYENTNIALKSANGESGIIFANQFHNNSGAEDWIYSRDLTDKEIQMTKKMQTADIGLFGQMYHKNLTVTSFFGRTEYANFGWMDPLQSSDNNVQARLFVNLDYKTKLNDDWEILTSGTWNKINLELFGEGRFPGTPLFPKNFPAGQEVQFGSENASDFLIESYISGTIVENLNVLAGGLIANENKWQMPDTRPFDKKNGVDELGNPILEEVYVGTRVPDRYHNMFYTTYGQIDYRFLDRVKVIAGFQANKPEKEDMDFVPRLGVISDIVGGLGVKLLYGHAFRSPIMPEKASVEPNTDLSKNTLDPEKVKTMDAQVFYTKDKVSASATYFKSRMSNFIALSQADAPMGGFYNNKDEIIASGVELEAKVSPLTGLMVSGSWLGQNTNKTFTPKGSTSDTTHHNVAQSPNSILKFGVTYTSPFKLTTGIFMEHYAATSLYGKKILPVVKSPTDEAAKSTMLNANVGYTLPFKNDLTINVAWKNMLDDGAKQSHILSGGRATDYASRESGSSVQVSLSSSF